MSAVQEGTAAADSRTASGAEGSGSTRGHDLIPALHRTVDCLLPQPRNPVCGAEAGQRRRCGSWAGRTYRRGVPIRSLRRPAPSTAGPRLPSKRLFGREGSHKERAGGLCAPFHYFRSPVLRSGWRGPAAPCNSWFLQLNRPQRRWHAGGAECLSIAGPRHPYGAVLVKACGIRPGRVLVISLHGVGCREARSGGPGGQLTSAFRSRSTWKEVRRCAPPRIHRTRGTEISVAPPGSYSRRASPLQRGGSA